MELTLVMPVYNEQDIIGDVIRRWHECLDGLGIDFELCVYDDGSSDSTTEITDRLCNEYPKLKVIHKKNSGHGPSVLAGYRESDADWIFQTDSDNEIGTQHFASLWKERKAYDLVIGRRINRESNLSRRIISGTARFLTGLLFGSGITDVNCPYRLYRNSSFRDAFEKLPGNTFAPNVILSGFACLRQLRILEVNVPFTPRQTGETSIKKFRLLKAALKSFAQTMRARNLFC